MVSEVGERGGEREVTMVIRYKSGAARTPGGAHHRKMADRVSQGKRFSRILVVKHSYAPIPNDY